MRTITAKYNGHCSRCKAAITRGQMIIIEGRGRVSHPVCVPDEVTAEARAVADYCDIDSRLEDSYAAACGL